jgi:hypothetical protein
MLRGRVPQEPDTTLLIKRALGAQDALVDELEAPQDRQLEKRANMSPVDLWSVTDEVLQDSEEIRGVLKSPEIVGSPDSRNRQDGVQDALPLGPRQDALGPPDGNTYRDVRIRL